MAFVRTTLFKALKLPNGKVVCIHPEYLSVTTKVIAHERDYELAKSLGWCEHPQEALDRFEADECALSEAAAVRAYEDRSMSPAAQAEASAVEQTTVRHLAEIPEAPKRGRPKKSVQ